MSRESGDTATLAQVYADQGHYGKAMEIYDVLVRENPGRDDYRNALEALKSRLKTAGNHRPEEHGGEHRPRTLEELVPLFEEWTRLLLRYNRLRGLMHLKDRLPSIFSATSKINPQSD